MSSKTRLALVATFTVPFVAVGCTHLRPKVWVEETRELTFAADGVDKLTIDTHNGDVAVTGDESRADVHVIAKCKGGGGTHESAQACLAAIEIVSRSGARGAHRLAWKWNMSRQRDWSASVEFKVAAPARLALDADTHNGDVTARGLDGKCRLTSHNGDIEVRTGPAPLTATTHNGDIAAHSRGETITLTSHNGDVHLDASAIAKLNGKVGTHNGRVIVEVGAQTGTELSCNTYNGRITCDVPWQVSKITRRSAKGVIGAGGAQFAAETYNGNIKVIEGGGA